MAGPDAMIGKAWALAQNRQPDAALQILEACAGEGAANPLWWSLRAHIRQHFLSGQRSAAEGDYRRALALDPNCFPALVGLGQMLHGTRAQEESLSLMERALRINPDAPMPLILSVAGALLTATRMTRSVLIDRVERFLKQDPPLMMLIKAAYWCPFLEAGPDLERRAWRAIRHKMGVTAARENRPRGRSEQGSRRIRLGYISPNLRDHSIGHVTRRLFEHHDRERFEVHVYPTGHGRESREFGAHIRDTCDHYQPLGDMQAARAAEVLRKNQVDILVDLNGYMGATQIIEIFRLRPAPVQVYWLGHGGGLGLPFYDYIIGDPVVTPPEDDVHYVEAVARLPEVFAPADPYEVRGRNFTRAECGLDKESFVYCGFNNLAKLSPGVLEAWARILRQVPGAQLWLSEGNSPSGIRNLKAAFSECGVEPDRLVFGGRLPDKGDHFARLKLADLFLDTFSVSAATTALDALWAGVPVLTRPGEHYCSRIGASFVKASGLGALICRDTDEYVRRAVALAGDRQPLEDMKAVLRRSNAEGTLFDPARVTRFVEKAYEHMLERADAGKPPASFDVDGG